jgi:radical SAM superfamily enzyme YgiQ (UPF0313 family)
MSTRPTEVRSLRTKVGLVQINSSFSGQHYFPYSVGILQAYAMKHLRAPERYEFLLPIYHRRPVSEAVEHLKDAEVVCFSTYVWNVRLSLAIAEALKRRNPEILVVFGGPQVPRCDTPGAIKEFLGENRCVDLAVHGPGESPFLSVLEHGVSGDWEKVPSVSFLDTSGALRQTAMAPGFKDLSEVPSPYVTGVFDPLMAANPGERWIGLWETDRNCPFKCTFCGWGLLESKPVTWDLDHVFGDVDWFAAHKVEFIFCANANFGLLPRDIEIARYVAKVKAEHGFPQKLSVQDTKNVKKRAYEVRKIIQTMGLSNGVVISLQSLDPQTLKNVKRDNISLEDFFEVQSLFAAEGIETMTDLILGLPGETYDSFAKGVSIIIETGQHNRIQFNNLSIVPDAEMAHPEERKRYGLQTVQSKIVNIHGLIEDDEVPEIQELVIGTAAMPPEDWVRARRLAWTAGLLHFDKILQIPLIMAHELGNVSYRDLIELFSEGKLDVSVFPILSEVQRFFTEKARDIQSGGVEYCHAPDWLNIYWPADEYILIWLAAGGKLSAFYEEAERTIQQLLASRTIEMPFGVMRNAVELNQHLLKLPFQATDLEIECSYNVWEYYRSVVRGKRIALENGPLRYRIDRTTERWDSWDEWFEKVVWYGNKRGAYLYGNHLVETQLAGHF